MMLKSFEALYQMASATKNFLYDKEILKSIRVEASVISIGNLSFGGTGKTPCIEFLAQELTSAFKVAVVCRSYKTSLQAPTRVDLSVPQSAQKFGDEACLLKNKLPQCEVWSGPQKFANALAAQALKPDLILVDDGFSHRQLVRDFDLVLFDATQEKSYLRENLSSLRRAHAVLLTKTNFATSEQISSLKQNIIKTAPQLQNSIYLSTTQTTVLIETMNPLFVFCGLAQPQSFKMSIEKLGYDVQNFEVFPDHFAYTIHAQERLVNKFLQIKNKFPHLQLLTTEKDAIKLSHPELLKHLQIAKHKMNLNETDKVGLLEKIRSNL